MFTRVIADENGPVYLPYEFSGAWTGEEKQIVKSTLDKHVPEHVYASFNNWHIAKYHDGLFTARRATWTMGGITGETAQELTQKIAEYYHD
jgi:hypothetical protein